LVTDAELVRKVYFPRLIMPLANVISPLLDFLIAFVVLLILMAFYGIAPSWKMLVIPPLMMIAALLALSMGLWLGPINVRFRDIKHTLPFMIQIWMYASPIVYPLSMVPQQYQTLYALNPMVGVIEGFRWAVFNQGELNVAALATSGAVIVVLLVGGLIFFRRAERTFADVI
jgi:lipopolysaccharide transport system permease protein